MPTLNMSACGAKRTLTNRCSNLVLGFSVIFGVPEIRWGPNFHEQRAWREGTRREADGPRSHYSEIPG
jgi:hypothetical protein